jgi:magnesium transporter
MDTTSTLTAAVAEFTKEIAKDADSTAKVPAHHANPVVAFIIGLAIILLASILNAAGLNLTKLDHVGAIDAI